MRLQKATMSIAAGMLAALLAGCPKPEDGPSSGADQSLVPDVTGEAGTGVVAELAAGITLTPELVERWIASTGEPEVRKVLAIVDSRKTMDDPGQIKAAIARASGSAELDEAVKAHGFKGSNEWIGTTARIIAGAVPALMEVGLEMVVSLGVDEDSAEYLEHRDEVDKKIDEAHKAFGAVTPEEQTLVD